MTQRMTQRMTRTALSALMLSALTLAACTPYPDAAISCDPSGVPCPDGYVCAARPGMAGAACLVAGCSDTIVDERIGESCDDGNKNDLDLCANIDGVCSAVRYDVDVDAAYGFGEGGTDPLTVPLGRPSLVAANDRELLINAVGENKIVRVSLTDNRAGPFGGNGSLVALASGAVDDAPPNEVVTVAASSMTLDGEGNLFVADLQNNLILRFDAVTGRAGVVAGDGSSNTAGTDGPGRAPLTEPIMVTADFDGNVFFIDRNAENVLRVRRLDRATGFITTLPLVTHPDSPEAIAIGADGSLWVFSAFANRPPNRVGVFRVLSPEKLAQHQRDPTAPLEPETLEIVFGVADENLNVPNPLCRPPDTNQVRLVMDSEDPRRGYWLGGQDLIEVDFDAGTCTVVATVPVVNFDVDESSDSFQLRPTDLTRSGPRFFIADPTGGGVWTTTRTASGFAPIARFAGAARASNGDDFAAFVDELILELVQSVDSGGSVTRVPFCLSLDEPLAFRSLEFGIAIPGIHRVAFSNCNASIRAFGSGTPGLRDGAADVAQFNQPQAVVRTPKLVERFVRGQVIQAPDEVFYVADAGNDRIRQITIDFQAPGAPATVSTFLDGLREPSGIASDGTRLLVADTGNNRVIAVDVDDPTQVTTLFGPDQVQGPTSLVFLPINLLPADSIPPGFENAAVLVVCQRDAQRISAAFVINGVAGALFDLAGDGTIGDRDDLEDARRGQLRNPRAVQPTVPIASDNPTLSFFVIDGVDRIRRVDIETEGISLAGVTQTRLSTVTRTAGDVGLIARDDGALGALRTPTAIAAIDGGFFVIDAQTGRLRRVDATVSASPGLRKLNLSALTVSEGGALREVGTDIVPAIDAAAVVGARAIAVDDVRGVAYVTNGSARVRRIVMTGTDIRTWTASEFTVNGAIGLAGLAIDDDVVIAVDVDAHTVVAFDADDAASEAVLDVDADLVAGRVGARGFKDGAAADALFNEPEGVAVGHAKDGARVVYVADTANNRVRSVIDGVVATVVGDGEGGNGGEGRPAVGFPVDAPTGIAVDAAGNIVIAAQSALRMVQAGDDGIADGGDEVATLYGKAPRAGFPDAITRCLVDVAFSDVRAPGGAPDVYAVDACAGLLLPIRRTVGEKP